MVRKTASTAVTWSDTTMTTVTTWQSRPPIDPAIAPAEAGKHLVADRAGMGSELVDADLVAQQSDGVAAAGAVARQIGDVDRHQVHPDSTREGAPPPRHDRLGAGLQVGHTRRAQEPIRVADADDGQAGRTFCRPGRPVADRLTCGQFVNLDDAAVEADHRLHQ